MINRRPETIIEVGDDLNRIPKAKMDRKTRKDVGNIRFDRVRDRFDVERRAGIGDRT